MTRRLGTGGAGSGARVGSGDGVRERARMLNLEREGKDKECLCSGFGGSSVVWPTLVSGAAGGGASHRAITDADSFINVSPTL